MTTNTEVMPTVKIYRTVVRSLPVRLTEDELLKMGGDLAATVQDIASEESRQQDIKTQLKAKITELESRRSHLAITVSRKEEHRDVEVDIFHDYQRGVVEDIRRDTGEVVSRRVMRDDERQQPLPVDAA